MRCKRRYQILSVLLALTIVLTGVSAMPGAYVRAAENSSETGQASVEESRTAGNQNEEEETMKEEPVIAQEADTANNKAEEALKQEAAQPVAGETTGNEAEVLESAEEVMTPGEAVQEIAEPEGENAVPEQVKEELEPSREETEHKKQDSEAANGGEETLDSVPQASEPQESKSVEGGEKSTETEAVQDKEEPAEDKAAQDKEEPTEESESVSANSTVSGNELKVQMQGFSLKTYSTALMTTAGGLQTEVKDSITSDELAKINTLEANQYWLSACEWASASHGHTNKQRTIQKDKPFDKGNNNSADKITLSLQAEQSLQEAVFDKGIGTVGTSSISYNIAGAGVTAFEVYVGMDKTATLPDGSNSNDGVTSIQVLIDGAVAGEYQNPTKTAKKIVLTNIPSTAQTLELKIPGHGANFWGG